MLNRYSPESLHIGLAGKKRARQYLRHRRIRRGKKPLVRGNADQSRGEAFGHGHEIVSFIASQRSGVEFVDQLPVPRNQDRKDVLFTVTTPLSEFGQLFGADTFFLGRTLPETLRKLTHRKGPDRTGKR